MYLTGDRIGKVARPFKFLNCLAKHSDFLPMVKDAWKKHVHSAPMAKAWRKLKLVRELKKLNRTEFLR